MKISLITIIYSTIAGLSTLLGSYLVIKFEKWTKTNMVLLISFVTGTLLAIAFLDILPEAVDLNKNTFIYVLLSIVILYIIEHRIRIHSCHDEHCTTHHAKGTVSTLGLGLHSLLDGLIIGAGFSVSTELGILTALAVILHEIPEGISIYSILKHAGYSKKKNLFYSFLVAIATPIGAILSLLIFKDLTEQGLGIWLAMAAGAIIYIGASDLVPETHEKPNKLNIVFLLLGILSIYLLTLFFEV